MSLKVEGISSDDALSPASGVVRYPFSLKTSMLTLASVCRILHNFSVSLSSQWTSVARGTSWVTWLVEFSPIGRLLILGCFLITELALDKNGFGYILGTFFLKLIWSPCSRPSSVFHTPALLQFCYSFALNFNENKLKIVIFKHYNVHVSYMISRQAFMWFFWGGQ
jgi:hypothetical protein